MIPTREPARLGPALYKSVQIPASLLARPVSNERLPAQPSEPVTADSNRWFTPPVAGAVGFIALAGVAAEFGVIMLLYLNHAVEKHRQPGQPLTDYQLTAAIREGAVLRVRPKMMTVATIMAGLLPIMWGGGTGSEIMQRIAAPMVGGMVSTPLLSMLVIPALFLLIHRNTVEKQTS